MPLKSLKVLDFSTLLPGPFATMMLADMGAEVLRVESPNRQDLTRILPPLDEQGVSYIHQTLNRSKRSIGLDLKKQEAVDLVKKMVTEYDIVIEQFRPGVMQRFGLDYQSLKEINPKLIYCSITGYGQTGPYKHRGGHDINYLAIAGVASYTGTKETGPVPVGFQIADVAGGSMHAVNGILAAVIERQISGEGQYIDISMTDAAFALNAMSGAGALGSGIAPGLEQETLNGASFYNHYETKDGRYFSVGSIEPAFMQQLCQTIGREDLIKNGFDYSAESQAPLIAALKGAFIQHDFDYWQDVFVKLDACVEPTLTVVEAAEHPQMQARNMVVEVTTTDNNKIKQIASPIKFSRNQPNYTSAGCRVGHHNQEVLTEMGFNNDEIETMQENGVLG
ncbi:CaiB/BaiF CoA-transferase family protein [Thalassotalea nanhaiensis]|uniref:CaiB/BaiF CoA-transferase family protein n=1 Tax=Thalassotalea nanhaiensis TaxID=3065648 RepID=A0ABY9TD86_9GAMM|nr:CaiB/BaiF CoA-transferase family protein [Colwelliaceae bacterium SQ345]